MPHSVQQLLLHPFLIYIVTCLGSYAKLFIWGLQIQVGRRKL